MNDLQARLQVRPLDYLSKCRALLPAEVPESRAARMAVKPHRKRDEVSFRCTPMSELARHMAGAGIRQKAVSCVCETQLFWALHFASLWAAVPERSYVCQIPWDCWSAGRLAAAVLKPRA